MKLSDILYLIVALILAVIAFNFLILLLPIIFILVIAYVIYLLLKASE